MKKWLSVIVCCCMMLTVLAACGDGNGQTETTPAPEPTPEVAPNPAPAPSAIYVLDFADGKTDFLAINTGTPGTDRNSGMVISDLDGGKALKLTTEGGHIRLGINVAGLLGDRIPDVRNVVFDIYADYPDGNFSAVSGRITAMNDEPDTPFAEEKWQIYLASGNPKEAVFKIETVDGFLTAGPTFIEFSCLVNGPADRGETPADIYIKSITFFDNNNEAIALNTGAGWAHPEGWGDSVALSNWELPYPPPDGNPGGWQTWFTPGTDDIFDDLHMPWEILAASYGIVFEMEQPDSFGLVLFGENINGWSSPNWSRDYSSYWSNGKLTVMWDDYGEDPSLMNDTDEDGTLGKIAMGNWNGDNISSVYLLYDAESVDIE
ncbi:MAG: hypothetical protein FWD38_03035 [Oscillospiraceae bacterium]|nr:hypothetical protein [Oscillospiraceae bacterium]